MRVIANVNGTCTPYVIYNKSGLKLFPLFKQTKW